MPSSMPHAVRLVWSAGPSSDSACHLPHGPMQAKRAVNAALTTRGVLTCDAVLETEDETELKLLARCSAARSTISASSSEGGQWLGDLAMPELPPELVTHALAKCAPKGPGRAVPAAFRDASRKTAKGLALAPSLAAQGRAHLAGD